MWNHSGISICAHTSALPANVAARLCLASPHHGSLLLPRVCFRTAGTATATVAAAGPVCQRDGSNTLLCSSHHVSCI
jgi:hypothetical protein